MRGAREHNLQNLDVEVPRDALVVFTGISGSGKSSVACSTLYAEAQRRYLESVSPYARRLFDQMPVPEVDAIDGLPPAVALQQRRGSPTTRSSVGSVSTLSNLVRMLYSRAGTYAAHQAHLEAEAFSPNTPAGACSRCHGLGRVYEATERSMVPDDTPARRGCGASPQSRRVAREDEVAALAGLVTGKAGLVSRCVGGLAAVELREAPVAGRRVFPRVLDHELQAVRGGPATNDGVRPKTLLFSSDETYFQARRAMMAPSGNGSVPLR